MVPAVFSGKWLGESAGKLMSVVSVVVFLLLDFLDTLFCILYGILDEYFEGDASPCYCGQRRRDLIHDGEGKLEGEMSETLYERKNVFREMGFLGFARKRKDSKKRGGVEVNRWSDCGCESCVSWMKNGDQKLYVIVREPSKAVIEDSKGEPAENVIFLHGFLSSSSFWTETVFPNLSETIHHNYRLFAVDLLGFGRSPKPRDCSYTLNNHVEMIEKSVISPFQLDSFHLVAHSMGCIIALALAAKYSNSVKSITLVAPPYFGSSKDGESLMVLNKVAGRRLWPPLSFGSSFMSWDLHFTIMDLSRHTHRSAWHTMHNVICGGAKVVDGYLTVLAEAGVKMCVVHGDRDQVVPLECSNNIKMKAPEVGVNVIKNGDHGSVIHGREKEFAGSLERTWASLADIIPTSLECCSENT